MKLSRGRIVPAFVLALGLALGWGVVEFRSSSGPEPRAAEEEPTVTRAELPELPKEKESDHPALNSYRVFESSSDDGVNFRGVNYTATVDGRGVRLTAKDFTFRTGGATVQQGSVFRALPHGTVSRSRFGVSDIDRGSVVEQYIFENKRVEQLFQIAKPIGQGDLQIRVDVDTTLTGKVKHVPQGALGWRESALWNGGLVFHDAEGDQKLAYHSAVAIDADGKRFAFEPRYENGQIVLDIPGLAIVGDDVDQVGTRKI